MATGKQTKAAPPAATAGSGGAKAEEPKRNIIFVGVKPLEPPPLATLTHEDEMPEPLHGDFVIETERGKTETVNVAAPFSEPPASVSVAGRAFLLPSAAEQRAGFCHEHANLIIGNVPGFKRFRENKGDK